MTGMVLASGEADPNVKIPAAIRASIAATDALHKEVYNSEPGEPPADPDAQPTSLKMDGIPPASPAAEPPAPPAAEPPANTPPAEDDATLQQRYNSLRGRMEKANETIRSMSSQISDLQRTLAAMQSARPAPVPPELSAENLLSPEEVEEYGDQFLSVVGKKAREELAPIFRAYEQRIASLQSQVEGTSQEVVKTSRDRMHAAMDVQLPNWRDLNRNKDFLTWLALPDPLSGAIRHDMLKAAYERNDTARCLAFFNGFLSDEAATAPQATTATVTPPGKVPLESLAAPGRAKTAAATGPAAEKPPISTAQISKFYAEKTAGKYRGREAEADAFEQEIFAAQRDGRIR